MANSRPFMDFLREHRNGQTHDDLSDALQDVVAGVIEEGKGGTLILTIKVKPLGKSDGLEVSADIKAAPPKPTPGVSIFFASPENNLVRQDPRQTTMELREIGAAAPARDIGAPSSAARALA